jgi:AmiR/NasT family two-component response regulator
MPRRSRYHRYLRENQPRLPLLLRPSARYSEILTEQLQTALNSRVIIEQAKGALSAQSGDLDMERAFSALRGYARAHNRRLADLSRDVADAARSRP